MKKTNILITLMVLNLLLPIDFVQAQGFTRINIDDQQADDQNDDQNDDQSTTTTTTTTNDTTATTVDTSSSSSSNDLVRLDSGDVELKDLVAQMSNMTGKNFILSPGVLRNKKITIISDKPLTREMAYQAFLSALEINGLTVVTTPAGLINIVPQAESKTKPLDVVKDPRGYQTNTDKFITRIIQLNNISAKEISQVIQKLVSKEAHLFAYPSTNSIILTETGSNIDRILRLIKELDQEGPQEDLAMIPVIHADAKSVAEKIKQLFQDKEDQPQTARRRRRGRNATEDLDDVQAVSNILADERTNSVLVMGTSRAIRRIREFVARLDRPIAGSEGRIHVYYLKYADAEKLEKVLQNLVQGAASAASSKTTNRNAKTSSSTSNVELEGGVKVTADKDTNSLVVVASPKDFQTLVKNVIEKLDIARPQVYLEAVIMSLDVQKSTRLGVSGLGGFSGSGLTGFGSILPMSTSSLATIAGASGGLGGGVLSSDTIDLTLANGETTSIPAVSGIIMALSSDTDANVLSTPSIMTLNNQKALIVVGQEVPVLNGSSVTTGGLSNFDVTREDVGIELEITPSISENDSVILDIKQKITSVFTSDPNLGPTFDKKSVETWVMAKNKQTIVIGGLIDDKATVSTQKVPLLGDIPVLGNLFRSRETTKKKTNLVVFITPYIIRERKDYLAVLKKKIEERNKFIDMNYGTSQKKLIRASISDHAQELLEFQCMLPGDDNPCGNASTTIHTNDTSQVYLKNQQAQTN